jgi:hypothetical protein
MTGSAMHADARQSTIVSLVANVSRQEAVRAFSQSSLETVYWRTIRCQLQRIAPAYVPFYLYRASYDLGRTQHLRLFALDAVEGVLDLFEFPRIPQSHELTEVETRNVMAARLTQDRAETLLKEKILRVIFQQGFFRVREPKLQIEKQPLELGMPYWLGFYGTDGSLRCRVMDAVRRRMEGSKATSLFEHWLAA